MVLVSSPGKVILFGEHAVVYGAPALAGAIERRVFVEAERMTPRKVEIISGGKKSTLSVDKVSENRGRLRYIKRALKIGFESLGEEFGVRLKVKSQLHNASGLGSSAAVSVATLKALFQLGGREIAPEELARLGHQVEAQVQGSASPTDTAATALGGVLFVGPEGIERVEVKGSLPLMVGCTGISRSTRKQVEKVRRFKEGYPEVAEPIIEGIEKLTLRARGALEQGDYENLGLLMRVNQGLLEALGVGHPQLSRRINSYLRAGALGAKLTGAGGGGCMVALLPEGGKKIRPLDRKAFATTISEEGVRVER